jgi:putative addiction module component (TIGR02574 family)
MNPDTASDPGDVPVEEWHKAELDRREAAAVESPKAGSSWEEVKARITGGGES